MINTIIWGFCRSNGREIINALKPSLNITDWISDQEGSSDIWQFILGKVPLAERHPNAVQTFGDFYQQHFNTFSVMVTRRSLYYPTSIHELTNEFALNYYYFYRLVTEQKTQLIIFANLPHEGPEYILYQIAKRLGIKTLMCYQSLFANRFFLTTQINDFGCFKTIPAIFQQPEITLEYGHQQKLFYMHDIKDQQAKEQQAEENKRDLQQFYFKVSSACKKSNAFLKRVFALLLQVRLRHLNITKITPAKIASRWAMQGPYRLQYPQQALYEKNMKQCVVDRTALRQMLNTSKHLVYFPLHLQPELSTSAIGGVFQDQLYAIETLRALLGDEWTILVKENPKQSYFQRDELFFKRLSNIAGVKLVDKLFPSIEIIEKVAFTATITGTAGWEAIKGCGKCLIFGLAWYASLENCLSYYPALTRSELADFLAETKSFAVIRQSFDKLMQKAGVGIADPYYAEMATDYNDKQNAANVAQSLMAVIESPSTSWH